MNKSLQHELTNIFPDHCVNQICNKLSTHQLKEAANILGRRGEGAILGRSLIVFVALQKWMEIQLKNRLTKTDL